MNTVSRVIAATVMAAALGTAGCAWSPPADSITPTPIQPVTQAPPPATEAPESTEERTECDKLSKADVKAITFAANSKKIDITGAAALPLSDELRDFNGGLARMTRIIALDVSTPDGPAVPILATDDDLIEFIGVNDDALKNFHTLAGMTGESGTSIQDYRDQLSESDEASAVEACIETASVMGS
jgi:hypothetical protein